MSCLRAVTIGATLALGFMSGAAHGQVSGEFMPRDYSTVDERGVDLAQRTLTVVHSISIGDPDHGGMSYSLVRMSPGVWQPHQGVFAFVRFDITTDPDTGSVYENRTLRFQGKTELMDWDGGSNYHGELGSRVTWCGNWCMTGVLRDGTVLTFDNGNPISVAWSLDTESYALRIVSAQKPNGERLDFHYLGPNSPHVRSITNNHGYQLRFNYPNETSTGPSSVVLFNMAVDRCDPNAATCPAFSRTWPSLSIAAVSGTTEITEAGGAKTVYRYESGPGGGLRISQIDGPGTKDTSITYQDCGGVGPGEGRCSAGTEMVGGFRVHTVTRGGRTWTYTWDPSLTTSGQSQHGVSVTSAAGSVGYTTRVAHPGPYAYGDLYREASSIIRIRDELGYTTHLEHYGFMNPQLSKITYPEGNGEQYTYDGRANITQIRRFAKPGSGFADQITTITRGQPGPCTQPAYCNKPVLIRDARGYVTRNTWNPTTGLLESTEAGLQGPDNNLSCSFGSNLCPVTSYGYTSLNAYFYNAAGQMTAASPAIRKLTSTTQCDTASTCAAAEQIVTTTGYGLPNAANNLLVRSVAMAKNGEARTTTYHYDPVGNRDEINGPRTDVSDIATFVWDADRRLVDRIEADSSAVRNGYSPEGYLETLSRGVMGPSGQFTAYEVVSNQYDTGGNLTRVSSPASVIHYYYDAAERLTCTALRMNPNVYGDVFPDACSLSAAGDYGYDRITRNVYNAAGEITSVLRAYGTSLQQSYVSYGYTPNGKRDWMEDANGNRTNLDYDGFDRLSRMDFPQPALGQHAANSSDYEQYGYDENNNRRSLRLRSTEVIDFYYDALNREKLSDLPGTALDVHSTYDLLNRRLSARYESTSGPGVVYTYDAWGGVRTETTYGRQLEYRYDEAGNRSRLIWPDGNFIQYTYDAMNRMDQVRENGATVAPGLLADYSYDALGRRDGLGRGNGTATGYGYDGVSRLSNLTQNLAAGGEDVAMGFTHNPANQIRTRTLSNDIYSYPPGTVVNRTYVPNGLNRYSSVDGTSFNYDARGNLRGTGARTYDYDLLNRLTSVANGNGTSTLLALSYDPLGRLHQTVGSTTTQYLYAGDQLVAEFNGGSSTPTRRYVHGAGVDEALVWYEGGALSADTRRWLHANHQASIVGASDKNGKLIGSAYTYSAYGEPNRWAGSRFRFTGQATLPEAQLYHYKARVYDPVLGRFLQTDPVGYEDDVNLYAYVKNDPLNAVDPTGTYSRGSGFSSDEWRKFNRAQQSAASKLERAAAKIEKALESGKGLKSVTKTFEKTFGAGSATRDNMAFAARTMKDMAGVLRDNSSQHVATGMSSADYQKAGGSASGLAGVPHNLNGTYSSGINVNLGHPAFGDHKELTRGVGHESAHNLQLRHGWVNGQIAYSQGFPAQKQAFAGLPGADIGAALRNPDHLMKLAMP